METLPPWKPDATSKLTTREASATLAIVLAPTRLPLMNCVSLLNIDLLLRDFEKLRGEAPSWRIARKACTAKNIVGGDETKINARLEISHGRRSLLFFAPVHIW
jgi:hypothetical protein